jgi:hypothetical protein
MILTFTIGIFIVGINPATDARFVLTLDDLGTPGVDIRVVDDVDGGIGSPTSKGPSNVLDGMPGDGLVFYTGPVGVFTVNITTGMSKPIIGPAEVGLSSVNVSGGIGSLEIVLTDTDFFLPGQQTQPVMTTNSLGGVTDGLVTAQGWLDPANAEFGMAITAGPQGPFGPGVLSGTLSSSPIGPLGPGAFSLSETVRVEHFAAGESTSFGKTLSASVTPEPSTLLLFGFGALGFIGYGWRRWRKNRSNM